MLASHGLPSELVHIVSPFQFFFGFAIVLGFQTRLAALGLFGFCVLAPSMFHTENLNNWLGDVSLAGGFMLLAIFGPGPWSVDAHLKMFGQKIFGAVRNDAALGYLTLITRALIASYFLFCGWRDWTMGGPTQLFLEQTGLPGALLYALALMQIAGGVCILFGYQVRTAAVILAAYALLLGFTVHNPFDEIGAFRESFGTVFLGMFTSGEMSPFGRDLAAAGTMLFLLAYGAGPFALGYSPSDFDSRGAGAG
jgi:putative oxidoreductase